MRYSVIVPVYNRPEEVKELLESLCAQTFTDFEVILVEDGSSIPCKSVAREYSNRLSINYLTKPNSGPGQSRNYGADRASGKYLIILDSDVMVPPGYFQAIEEELAAAPADAFGGPDRAHPESLKELHMKVSTCLTPLVRIWPWKSSSAKSPPTFSSCIIWLKRI